MNGLHVLRLYVFLNHVITKGPMFYWTDAAISSIRCLEGICVKAPPGPASEGCVLCVVCCVCCVCCPIGGCVGGCVDGCVGCAATPIESMLEWLLDGLESVCDRLSSIIPSNRMPLLTPVRVFCGVGSVLWCL